MVRTEVLNRPDGSGQQFAKAMAGAWYELMAEMSKPGPQSDKVLTAIASVSEDTLASYKEQLSTTHMFYTPQSGAEMATSEQLKKTMELVRQFCFSHGLLGEKTRSADDVAMRFPDGSIARQEGSHPLALRRVLHATGRAGEIVSLLQIHAQPSRTTVWILSWFLFAAGLGSYFWISRSASS